MDVLRTKSVDLLKEGEGQTGLKRTLTALDLVLLGIGCIIGTGIFVLTGVAAAKYAGPGIMFSFVFSGLACALTALTYAELASMVPVSGSSYTYAYAALGEIFAWMVGWDLILEYCVGASAVASGWSAYFLGLLKAGGIVLPVAITAVPLDGGLVNLPAILIVMAITWLLIKGVRESSNVNKGLVLVKLAAVVIFLALAGPKVSVANWTPLLPYGFSGVAAGAAIVFFAYIGFDSTATAAEECRNPRRDLPIGIIGSLLVCTALYILVAAVLTGIVPYGNLNTAEPVTYALRAIGMNTGAVLVGVGALAGITTVLLVLMYGQTRILYAMSRDGLIPTAICRIHPRYCTPDLITLITGGAVAIVAGFIPIVTIAELTNIGTLFAFALSAVGVLVLRYARPDLERPFKCPAVFVVAPLAVLACIYLILNLSFFTWMRFLAWSIIGFAVYFLYGYRHSFLSKHGTTEK